VSSPFPLQFVFGNYVSILREVLWTGISSISMPCRYC